MSTVQIERENSDNFPLGLRVLAVHDDPVRLKRMESMLRRCEFHVTAASQAIMAINLLRKDKDQFDLVLSRVPLPDMDGFEHMKLECTGRELPVIMVSANRDPEIVLKRLNSTRHLLRRKPVAPNNSQFLWTRKNRMKFLEAAKLSGFENAAPERILELMNVEGLTHEEVAYVLQVERSSLRIFRIASTQQADIMDKDFQGLTLSSPYAPEAVPESELMNMEMEGLTLEDVATVLQVQRSGLEDICSMSTQHANIMATGPELE